MRPHPQTSHYPRSETPEKLSSIGSGNKTSRKKLKKIHKVEEGWELWNVDDWRGTQNLDEETLRITSSPSEVGLNNFGRRRSQLEIKDNDKHENSEEGLMDMEMEIQMANDQDVNIGVRRDWSGDTILADEERKE